MAGITSLFRPYEENPEALTPAANYARIAEANRFNQEMGLRQPEAAQNLEEMKARTALTQHQVHEATQGEAAEEVAAQNAGMSVPAYRARLAAQEFQAKLGDTQAQAEYRRRMGEAATTRSTAYADEAGAKGAWYSARAADLDDPERRDAAIAALQAKAQQGSAQAKELLAKAALLGRTDPNARRGLGIGTRPMLDPNDPRAQNAGFAAKEKELKIRKGIAASISATLPQDVDGNDQVVGPFDPRVDATMAKFGGGGSNPQAAAASTRTPPAQPKPAAPAPAPAGGPPAAPTLPAGGPIPTPSGAQSPPQGVQTPTAAGPGPMASPGPAAPPVSGLKRVGVDQRSGKPVFSSDNKSYFYDEGGTIPAAP